MLTTVLIFAGVALVVFLLVVLVVQASLARLILQELNSNNVMQQSNATVNDPLATASTPVVRTYGMIVDAATSQTLSNTYGPPPAQTGHAVCVDASGDYSMQPVTYSTTLWLALKPTPNSTRFQQDVASGAITTVMIANVSAKVWLKSWPSSSSSKGPHALFVIAPMSSARAVDSTNYTATIVVDPMFTSSTSQSSWGALTSALAGGDESAIPVHIWAF